MIKEFLQFLKINEVLDLYLRECYEQNVAFSFDDLLFYIEDVGPRSYVNNVFAWPDSFWVDIHEDWNDYLTYWEEDLGKEWYLKGEYNENQL